MEWNVNAIIQEHFLKVDTSRDKKIHEGTSNPHLIRVPVPHAQFGPPT